RGTRKPRASQQHNQSTRAAIPFRTGGVHDDPFLALSERSNPSWPPAPEGAPARSVVTLDFSTLYENIPHVRAAAHRLARAPGDSPGTPRALDPTSHISAVKRGSYRTDPYPC